MCQDIQWDPVFEGEFHPKTKDKWIPNSKLPEKGLFFSTLKGNKNTTKAF